MQAIFQDPFATVNRLCVVDRGFFEMVTNYKLAKAKAQAIQLIDEKHRAVGLTYEDIATKYPSEFSGGQLQRIPLPVRCLPIP